MKKHNRIILIALALLGGASAFAQSERLSSSIYLPVWQKADVSLSFDITAKGKRFSPTWGLDQAWISEQNMRKGINHMGKENVGIGRSAFRFNKPLSNDSLLDAKVIDTMRVRNRILDLASPQLPIVFTADQEAWGGTDASFVVNRTVKPEAWAAMINAHVAWMQNNTKHPVAGVSPFNEGDYWTVEEGGSPESHRDVSKILKQKYARYDSIPIVGGNTLNNDKALAWYNPGKEYYAWGNTHQLAGSFNSFVAFYDQLQEDGKVGYADEMHNVGEAMILLEHGATVGIWWGFDSRARGEFCQISRHGERLAYGENRNKWTAASVYRHDDGHVKAFVGSSERQANTTTYQFVSTDRDVYYDGYGPVREFVMEIPGGTGYQKGQTNAERVIDVTWGEDVQPDVINGTYILVNKATGNVAAVTGSNVVMQKYTKAKTQKWIVKPSDSRIGGDYSFYDFVSVNNATMRMNVENFSTLDGANVMAYDRNQNPSSNEQWYLVYAGNGYYYLRNRETALYLSAASSYKSNGVNIRTNVLSNEDVRDRQLWRLLPDSVTYETIAPAQPQGLVAEEQNASVKLSWTANTEKDLAGYMVLRAEKEKGEWNTIARKLQATTFVDNNCRPGYTYIYKVKAIDLADNFSDCSDSVMARPTGEPGLVAHWNFESNLYDDTPNMADAACSGKPVYVAAKDNTKKALSMLTGTQYVQLPYEVASSDEMTITMWVKWGTATNWQRLFDFGYDTDHYLFLTPSNGTVMRFAIKNGENEQTVDCRQKLPAGVWKHVAVVIGKDKTAIYLDGVEAASSTTISIKPSDIHPVLNYIGRSQFTDDPYFRGTLDDLRIYNYALDEEAVKKTMEALPSNIHMTVADESPSKSVVYGLDGRQYDVPRKGVNIIDGKKRVK